MLCYLSSKQWHNNVYLEFEMNLEPHACEAKVVFIQYETHCEIAKDLREHNVLKFKAEPVNSKGNSLFAFCFSSKGL